MTGSITTEQPAGCVTAERFLAGRGLVHRRRPLKRWRYVGVFGEQLMACAAQVQIGPARQTFWALHVPATGSAGVDRERTRLLPRRGEVELSEGSPDGCVPGRLSIGDRGVELELELSEQRGIEARCPNGRSESWTRKQAGVRARGTLRLDGAEPLAIDALAVIDDSAGYHARVTEWRWSAGVGSAPDGTPLAWNLVSGINDPPAGSERAVWVDGVPREVGPVQFDPALGSIRADDGSLLSFRAEAERARRENLLIVSSDYRAPFGTFSGVLPGGIALASGRGVMEHHRARW
ncbi:MAG: hypothetical protein QOK19_1016 [Solirubrobacteraceae bacterium]|jgi:hypothetical protein|nr:hypothetical protein [Solirubrobacterales bacterium]MEA2215455.1 hypothetical protein [Solirubrobacteraceae bacterium]